MEMVKRHSSCAIFLICASLIASTVQSIGVNYGTLGDNLPPPAQVAQFLKEKTIIDRIKIFDVNPDIIRAFANTGILVTVMVPNGEIPNLLNPDMARQWVENNIKPYYPQTKINYICVGNEILHFSPQFESSLVGAMKGLHQALVQTGLQDIKVTTPHSGAIFLKMEPPSLAKLVPRWEKSIFLPMLQFLRETKSPFMINDYPYFHYYPARDAFFLFKSRRNVVYDRINRKWYNNMFDMMLDSTYTVMKNLGYPDIEIVVGETGWPSKGMPQNTIENAVSYNGALVRKSINAEGTPLMPHKKFETYIFGLFNENIKPGADPERNFGLFYPDLTPVYNVGIMKGQRPGPVVHVPIHAAPSTNSWCIPKPKSPKSLLSNNIQYGCGQGGVDCRLIQQGGICFGPNNVYRHAAYVMNAYFQRNGKTESSCNFGNTGMIVYKDPSYGRCRLQA